MTRGTGRNFFRSATWCMWSCDHIASKRFRRRRFTNWVVDFMGVQIGAATRCSNSSGSACIPVEGMDCAGHNSRGSVTGPSLGGRDNNMAIVSLELSACKERRSFQMGGIDRPGEEATWEHLGMVKERLRTRTSSSWRRWCGRKSSRIEQSGAWAQGIEAQVRNSGVSGQVQ